MTTTNAERAALDAAATDQMITIPQWRQMCNQLAAHTVAFCHAHPTRQAHTYDGKHRPVCGACAVKERGL